MFRELEGLGIDKQDHMSFMHLLEHVGVSRQFATGALHRQSLTIPTRAQSLLHALPPTLTTLTGLRGLLLYRNALQMQARDEATRFDDSPTNSAGDGGGFAPFGNPMADHLLLFRLLSLFYWPDRFSKVRQELDVEVVYCYLPQFVLIITTT